MEVRRSGVRVDFAKGALAAGVGILVDGHLGAFVLGGAAIIGHMLPITRRFKGGRGVATGAGVVFVIFPLLAIAGGLLWLLVVRITHKASVASITVMVAFPFAVAIAGHTANRHRGGHRVVAAHDRPALVEPAPPRAW